MLGAGQLKAVHDPVQGLPNHGELRLLRWVFGNSAERAGRVVDFVAGSVLLDEASAMPPGLTAGVAAGWSAKLGGQVLRRVLLEDEQRLALTPGEFLGRQATSRQGLGVVALPRLPLTLVPPCRGDRSVQFVQASHELALILDQRRVGWLPIAPHA